MNRIEIMRRLKEFNQTNGVAFLSPAEAEQYYKELVELIETISAN